MTAPKTPPSKKLQCETAPPLSEKSPLKADTAFRYHVAASS